MDSSLLVNRRQRAASVLRESLWSGRLVGSLVFAFIVRSIGYFIERVVDLPVGVPGLAAFVAYWIPLIVAPVYLPGEMRSASLVQVAVTPPKGELGRMPMIARLAAFGGIAFSALPVVLPLMIWSDGLDVIDDYTEVAARLVLPIALIVYVYRKVAAGSRRRPA